MSKIKGKKLFNTKNMTRLEWLKSRQCGIGGSDAASISGLNKWSSPLKVFMDKTEPIDQENEVSEAAEWGTRQEPLIREKFKENHPEWRVQRSFITWGHPEYDFMIANVDSLIFDPRRGWGVHEIKTTSEWRKDEWGEEEAPIEYIIQIHHYFLVMGLDWGIYSVLIGGNRYKEFYIKRDEDIIKALIKIESDFWFDHVVKKNPPLPNGSDSAEEILQNLHPVSSALPEDEVLELDDSIMKLINEYDEIKDQVKELEKRKKEIAQLIESSIGDYQVAFCGSRKVTWKPSKVFMEEELQKAEPDLFKEFSKMVLDKTQFKKSYPKIYEKFMFVSDKRTLRI